MADYLKPTAPIAADILLPSDPARAMSLAQLLIEGPLMANHSFGLWGYSGTTPGGHQLTVQSTGIGGPSAAAVLRDLAVHGARRAIRVGSAAALRGGVGTGARLVAATALAADGASRALGSSERASADAELSERLLRNLDGAQMATLLSTDLDGEHGADTREWGRRRGAVAVDLETAALFAAGIRFGVAVAATVVVVPEAPAVADDRVTAVAAPVAGGTGKEDDPEREAIEDLARAAARAFESEPALLAG